MSHASNAVLCDRAAMLGAVRHFFHERNILEVDCPMLSHAAPIDPHIDLFDTEITPGVRGYFHSSPEYGMKRLLARQIGSIYQLSHVYRKGEAGAKHNPEFTLIEWYRMQTSFNRFLNETLDLIHLFLGNLSHEILPYGEALQRYAGSDLKAHGFEADDPEELLNLVWGSIVEPELGKEGLTVITDYPPDQAALAETRIVNGQKVAERFEIYFKGVELGNGYHELTDHEEQQKRLEEANAKRKELGKEPLPIDNYFLEALQIGLPDSYGIAVGFDRLMMLRHETDDIASVLPFSWEES